MYKFLALLILIFNFYSCSDGDVKVQNLSFEDVTASSCGDIVYKIKGNETLLIIIPAIELAYINQVTLQGSPRVKSIGGAIRVIYRNYNGVPSGNNFCVLPPASTPNTLEEWNAIGGTIEITTTPVKLDPDPTTQATRILKYNHYIVFKNIIFQKPVGQQLYSNYIFGNYQTATTLLFPLTQSFIACATPVLPTKIFVNNNLESVIIDNLDPSLFVNAPNTVPIIKSLSATSNHLSISTYNSIIPVGYYCGITPILPPVLINTWEATNGTIEVTTTVSSGVYTHLIHIKNATISKTGTYRESFYLGNDFNLGDFVR